MSEDAASEAAVQHTLVVPAGGAYTVNVVRWSRRALHLRTKLAAELLREMDQSDARARAASPGDLALPEMSRAEAGLLLLYTL